MKTLSQTKQFSKDIKKMQKRGKDLEKIKIIVRKLAQGEPLEIRHYDHPLSGEWNNSRDCHIEPDWILIYTADSTSLRLERTGTHADLFR
ncbi:MAG: type II toxin-antitoxin system YafQ family toxin [Kiritimatiellae bacterium]|nr:type II toxin-antitoxin system YafQ family toxin [Kiritimatiellia bacterium]MDD5523159.1 type II toxin-antitoxin system YafQ family toxin [Kiritimatiellia bacterium]